MTWSDTLSRPLETDVLVVGGGIGGCLAALAARETRPDLRVAVVEKAAVRRSGAAVINLNNVRGVFPERLEDPIDPRDVDRFVDAFADYAYGMVDRHKLRVIAGEMRDRMAYLETLGLPVRGEDGKLVRQAVHGMSFPSALLLRDISWKPILDRALREKGVAVVERTMATGLLVEDGAVVGAAGLEVRTGEFRAFAAKSTLLATGGAARTHRTTSGLAYNLRHCPYTTGDGQVLGYLAGAELTCMELPYYSYTLKGFPVSGTAFAAKVGGRIINRLGERIMERYNPSLLERSPRHQICSAILRECEAGRGPCFLDFRHLPEEAIAIYVEAAFGERPVAASFVEQAGLDLRKRPAELVVTDAWSYYGGVSGLVTDLDGRSSVPGLYAVGDCAGGAGYTGSPNAIAFGWRAGVAAAASAGEGPAPALSPGALKEEEARTLAPLHRRHGPRPREVEELIQDAMSEGAGPVRDEARLRKTLDRLAELEGPVSELRAEDPHELVRAGEVRSLLLVGQMMARGALMRRESRWYHRRLDYPETNDAEWRKFIVIKKDGEGMALATRPIPA